MPQGSLEAAGVRSTVRCVQFYAYVGWENGIDMLDALHSQTILACGINGRELPISRGAPLRARVETQLLQEHEISQAHCCDGSFRRPRQTGADPQWLVVARGDLSTQLVVVRALGVGYAIVRIGNGQLNSAL